MNEESLARASDAIKKGLVVAYPTDTAYGLAVDANNLAAVKRLYAVKGRSFNKPVHVIFPSFSELNKAVDLIPDAKRLIQKLFPGPLTLVLPLKSKKQNWAILSGESGYLGFRMPDHPMVKKLVKLAGTPITTTSANVSGRANCYSVLQIKRQFAKKKNKPDYYLNGGKLKKVRPSTVILMNKTNIKLLREGPIPFEKIKKALNDHSA